MECYNFYQCVEMDLVTVFSKKIYQANKQTKNFKIY